MHSVCVWLLHLACQVHTYIVSGTWRGTEVIMLESQLGPQKVITLETQGSFPDHCLTQSLYYKSCRLPQGMFKWLFGTQT